MSWHAAVRRKWTFIITTAIILTLGGTVWDLHKTPPKLTQAAVMPVQPVPNSLQCTERLPLNVLAGQVLMIGLPAGQMAGQTSLFRQYHVGGAVLMSSPANPYDGSIKLFKSAGGGHGDPLLISTDEEGGIVQRFQSLGIIPAPQDVASRFSPAAAQDLITGHGAKLKSVGIDMILGPLADVAPVQSESQLGNRIFSNDPKTVANYDAAYVRGWQSAGLLPTLKHFPGMGSASGNTDYQPATTPPLSELVKRDFIPYKALVSSGTAVMAGNQNVPGWFSGPASLSPAVNKYLRQNLGYKNNLVVTDSLLANAITSTTSVSAAAVDAIEAGNDMVLIVEPVPDTITVSGNARLIRDVEAALQKAVQDGIISRPQLALSVMRKLEAQHIAPCTL